MIEVKNVKEMVSLSIGTRIFVMERGREIIKLDIGKVSIQEVDRIKICWVSGRNTWYSDSGHYWMDGRSAFTVAKYDTLINREYSRIFSLSESEYNYFQLFV